jgi:predicted negative regulator of RcsB-dependent stress response
MRLLKWLVGVVSFIVIGVGIILFFSKPFGEAAGHQSSGSEARDTPEKRGFERTEDSGFAERKVTRSRLRELGRRLRERARVEAVEVSAAGSSADFLAAKKRDETAFTQEEREEIDRLYEAGMDEESPDSTAALVELIRKYPAANRGGCAAMNLAARYLKEGRTDAAIELLSTLIKNESDAVFANGEKVLPKALFRLGLIRQAEGETDEAAALFDRVRASFPEAEDSRGVSYSRLVDEALARGE